jgi:uncharacterized membrane protein YidH (DUF202 family)
MLNPSLVEQRSRIAPLVRYLFFSSYFGLNFFLVYKQAFAGLSRTHYPSDLPLHIYLASQHMDGSAVGTHPGFQYLVSAVSHLLNLSLEHSSTLILPLFALATALVTYELLKRSLRQENYSAHALLLATGVLLIVSAIYAPFINPHIYLGQGSPNIWHNPTMTAMKPFALLTFLLLVNAIGDDKAHGHTRLYILAGISLLASAVFKPSFALVLIPSTCLLLVIKRRFDLLWKTALAFLPCLVLLAFQYLTGYATGNTGAETLTWEDGDKLQLFARDRIVFDLLGVWRTMTPNIPVSILLGFAFPLSVLAFRFRRVVRDVPLCLAWIMTTVGLLQFSILAEVARYRHGNFMWGYLGAMSLLFAFSMVEYLRWLASSEQNSRIQRIGLILSSILLSLHAVSGLFYLIRILSGGRYG